MNLPKPKAVIFDWDNTLVNTWPIIHAALNKTFAETGLPEWDFQTTTERVRKSMRDSFPEIFGPNWEEAGKKYQANYRAIHLDKLEALPGAEDVLKKVKALGLHSLVVSNKRGGNLRAEVTHIGWDKYFDKVVGADDAARDKPHTDPVHFALDKSGIVAGPDVWFIGDSEVDLECANACSCTSILFGELALDHPDYTPTQYQGHLYSLHLHSHDDTLKLLNTLI